MVRTPIHSSLAPGLQRGFARAIGPDQAVDFALPDVQGHAGQRGQPAEVFAYA